jgi:hypothetical protein
VNGFHIRTAVGDIVGQLRVPCTRLVYDTAEALIWGDYVTAFRGVGLGPPLRPVRGILPPHGCQDIAVEWQVQLGVFGQAGSEWGIVCTRQDSWALLIASADSAGETTELLRRDGTPEDILIASAPPEYFDWMTASEFESGQLARPAREVLLVYSPNRGAEPLSDQLPELVFFRTREGWASVRPLCCRGIGGTVR